MFVLEPRASVRLSLTLMVPVIAIILTLFIGGLIFGFLGYNPAEALYEFFVAPLSRPDQIGNLLVKACPLIIIGTGLVFCYRANVWNIGAEGQLVLGAMGAGWVALSFPDAQSPLFLFAMAGAAMLAGGLWGAIPAVLKVRFRTNEILVSLMLVYVAESILASVAQGVLKNPDGYGFPGSRNLQQYPSAFNEEVFANSGMHWGVITAFIAVIFTYVMMTRHIRGFEVRLMGEAPKAARFAGVSTTRLVVFCLGFSGALAGLAGMFEVSGPSGQITIDFNTGCGYYKCKGTYAVCIRI